MSHYSLVKRRLNFFQRLINGTYPQLFLLWVLLNIAFGTAYLALFYVAPHHAPNFPADASVGTVMLDALYFSVVTATTIGYGDFVPLGFSKILTMIQSISALLVFTVLVGKLVSQRQDETLHEVHRMTFEGVFYHIRHVLFIVRKDFDALILKIGNAGKFDAQDWDTLSTAYLQSHTLIEEIPELYNGHGFDLHNVDLNHEKLLFEALHRTLVRINKLITSMESAGIDWKANEHSFRELRTLLNVIEATIPFWKERSPFHEESEFMNIETLSEDLHRQLKDKTRL